jgi:hypothetical protein
MLASSTQMEVLGDIGQNFIIDVIKELFIALEQPTHESYIILPFSK